MKNLKEIFPQKKMIENNWILIGEYPWQDLCRWIGFEVKLF